MFKKLLKSLSKSQANKHPAEPVSQSAPSDSSPPSGTLKRAEGVSKDPSPPAKTAPGPEELCEITPQMAKDHIRERLKLLYRRYNRSASSLDPAVRNEAEIMLDAIVRVREKYFGEI